MTDLSEPRAVLHVDLDAFFAQVEQRANPALAGKPVFVGAGPGSTRGVVAAASYEAKRFGVKSGMSLREARALCPKAVLVAADHARYAKISDDIFQVLQAFSPQVEAASIDEFYLDVTRTADRWGGPPAVGRRVKEAVQWRHGLTCTVGIAPNKLLAKWLANRAKPDGLAELKKEDVAKTLERVPVGELCGIGPRLRSRLSEMGLLSCGELGRHPVGELAARFGVWGHRLSAMGRGHDDEPVAFAATEQTPKSVGHTQTLPSDVSDPDILQAWLLLQAERVAYRLRRENLAGYTVSLTLRDTSFETWTRQRRYADSTQDGREIFQRAWKLFPARLKGRPLRLVGVAAADLTEDRQLPLTEEERKRRRLQTVRDGLNRKFGDFTVLPARVAALRRIPPRGSGGWPKTAHERSS